MITASESSRAICRHSKYSKSHTIYPDPQTSPNEFIKWLKTFLIANDIDVVFPVTDITCNILAPLAPKLGDTKIPLANAETVKKLSDKTWLTQLAEKLNLPHPKSIYISDQEQLNNYRETLLFPCVIKPSCSKILVEGRWVTTEVTILHSLRELDELFRTKAYLSEQPFMIQEYIEGRGQGIFALYSHGQEIAWFAHNRIREKPPWGGVSVLSESIALPEQMVDIARKILDFTNWHGVAMVEFKVAADGVPYLIEINTRFWGSLQLAVDSGVDFPYLLYCTSKGEETGQILDYSYGNKLRWLFGDLDSLLITLKCETTSFVQKLTSLGMFLKPDLAQTRHEIFRSEDFKPAIFELNEYFRGLFASFKRQ